ncbi:hypothetical protein H4J42_13305 [Colwellia sp. BRX8-8]|nr:hypothetical protein [Colwellia sp. BRX8-8]
MNSFIIDNNNFIHWQETPWDEKVFSVTTAELTSLRFDSERNANTLIREFELKSKVNLAYGRFEASNMLIKSALMKNGYLPSETSLEVFLSQLDKYNLPDIYKKKLMPITAIVANDYKDISIIAKDMFYFSRFHEDPFIDTELSNKRMSYWVDDLFLQNVSGFIYRNKAGQLVSFMLFRLNDNNVAELILGCSAKCFGVYSPFFWGSVIDALKFKGVKKITSVISAANSGVLALYLNLNFNISKTKIDYHKHKVN